jgi:hypothetical protein
VVTTKIALLDVMPCSLVSEGCAAMLFSVRGMCCYLQDRRSPEGEGSKFH